MERDSLGYKRGFSEFYLDFVKRVPLDEFLVFEIVEESFERGDFPFHGLGLVFLMEGGDEIFQHFGGNFQ